MRGISIGTAFLALALTGLMGAPARAQGVCEDLWEARNSIYKAYGYCFKTARAIRRFGNAGCQYDREGAIPFSRADRARINDIVRRERRLGC